MKKLSFLEFQDAVKLAEEKMAEAKGTAYPATVDTLRKIVKDKQHQTVMFKSGKAIDYQYFDYYLVIDARDKIKEYNILHQFKYLVLNGPMW